MSIHFTLKELAKGVYAAIAKPGGGAVGNAGFVDLGDHLLVFDSFNTQQAAEDLKAAAESLTGKKVSWLINSHWHGDHIRGNQVFEECSIISTKITREKMAEKHPSRMQKQKEDIEGLHTYITSLKGKNEEHSLEQISFLEQIALSLPDLKLVLPTNTFLKEFVFHGTEKTAVLMTMRRAHSVCDSLLFLPEDKVVFMGDLLFVGSHPAVFEESDVDNWLKILEHVKTLDFTIAVPGHGTMGEKGHLQLLQNYLEDIKKLAGETKSSIETEIPLPYKEWASSELFRKNIDLLRKGFKVR
ncbi:MBL fold metallo-hydrolase [Bacillus sp. SCS-153A]|uniref:MBL fold metallo-hydrolase n=1 Tax=Rossellomorea sedimentorum TaxID=3115294 RepID=UPI003905AF47